jgi:hypothetical protein
LYIQAPTPGYQPNSQVYGAATMPGYRPNGQVYSGASTNAVATLICFAPGRG